MRLYLSLLVATQAFAADWPDDANGVTKEVTRLRGECEHGTAASCSELGDLYVSDYTVLANGYHHAPDRASARKAHTRAIELFGPACAKGDGKACNAIAHAYSAMNDRAKSDTYLERACTAKDAWSCFDRGQSNGRSKSSSVRWDAKACTLGENNGCEELAMMVLAAFVLDPVDHAPMDLTELRAAFTTASAGATPQHQHELELANVVVQLWAGQRKEALASLARLEPGDPMIQVFTAFVELAAADGVDKPRARAAWQRLTTLAKKKDDGSYKILMLESDYAWADPTAAMARAAAVAARNR